MIRRVGAEVPDKLIVVENWLEELKTSASESGRGVQRPQN